MKKFICFLSAFLCVFILVSCSQKNTSTREIFDRIYEALSPVPDGEIYFSKSDEGTRHYMSSALFSTIYENGTFIDGSDIIEEYTVYLSSFALPFEIAVFKCYSPSDTVKIEQMCIGRLDFLRKHFKNTEHENAIDKASVISDGKYVIMIICQSDADLFEISKSALN